jgi:hypothetical protein
MMTQTGPLAAYQDVLERELTTAGSQLSHHALLRYHLGLDRHQAWPGRLDGGSLCLAVADALGAERGRVLPIAVAVVLLQSVVLVQRDLRSEHTERDGRESLATAWGVSLALNAEDGFFSLAQVVLARLPGAGVPAAVALACQRHFDAACLRMSETMPEASPGTPAGAGLACVGLLAGVSAKAVDGLAGYGEALGGLSLGRDVASGDALDAAYRSLTESGFDNATKERLIAIAAGIAGGSKK